MPVVNEVLNKLDSLRREGQHLDQKPTVAPSLNVCGAVNTLPISDWHVRDFQVQFDCPKDQVEVAERIKVSKVRAVGCDLFVVTFPQDLCATQSVLNRLTQEPGKRHTEEFIRHEV